MKRKDDYEHQRDYLIASYPELKETIEKLDHLNPPQALIEASF